MLPDLDHRRAAIDPAVSCCVSAPAGSGKTELLIQRFLALLARVEEPERVVAITFTRKAAAEMRARLITALEEAAAGRPVASEHAALTRKLAEAVLSASSSRGWDLVASPLRLRIQTIDSFCGELTRQMPILSGVGGDIGVSDDSDPLYREAVEAFLADGDTAVGSDLRRLLLHLDNNWEAAADLLLRLLKRRDQWQRLLGARTLGEQQRGQIELAVDTLVSDAIAAVRGGLGDEESELLSLMSCRAEVLGTRDPFDPDSTALHTWCELSAALLTGTGNWRRSLTKREGFPVDSPAAKTTKAAMLALLTRLQERDGDGELLRALRLLRVLPDRGEDETHWAVLRSLVALLPRLAANLLLVFRRHGQVDHAQIALAAVSALGDDDTPTELALRLDHQIEHLLVDEFQDTSSGQFELLRRLTRGWAEHNAANPEAPRTLLLVGDAMQSIYGFREANVGLFIEARKHGVGDLALAPLELSVNFRSTAAIVGWVNAQFETAFPALEEPQLGAVSYSPSAPAITGGDNPRLRIFTGEARRDGELDWICEQLQNGLAREDVNSIAVLGRSRNVLRPLLAAMRERGIPYSGRDLDPLAGRMVVRDLLTLCELLQNHHDGFAWLALLRGPWCALDHADLLSMALAYPRAAPLIHAGPADPGQLPGELSAAARSRVAGVVEVIRWAEHYRDRLALRVWVEETWLRLGGAAAHPGSAAQRDAEQFLQQLEALEQEGLGLQPGALRERMSTLYAAPDDEAGAVQVMTLHKAKGLEFDWVFIPALDARTLQSNNELLLWDELVLPCGQPAFLLDIRSSADAPEGQRVYDYLKHRHREKRRLEDTRLLYVGCTRAARGLFLTAALQRNEESGELAAPAAGSLLGAFGAAIPPGAEIVEGDPAPGPEPALDNAYQRLERLPAPEAVPGPAAAAPVALDSNRLPRALGTAMHRCMEAIALRRSLPAVVDAGLESLLRCNLASAGCEPGLLDEYTQRGRTMLTTLLEDPWARWMLDPQHPLRAAERPLTRYIDGEAQQLVPDYVFFDEEAGMHWVVDYKTAVPAAGQSLAAFLADESERYGPQLSAYAAALRAISGTPVRCALYFVGLGQHHELAHPADGIR